MSAPRTWRMSRSLQLEQVASVETNAARADAARRLDEAHDRQRRHRLAAAGLADQAERLPGEDFEADIVDGRDGSGRRVEDGRQALDAQERCAIRHQRLPSARNPVPCAFTAWPSLDTCRTPLASHPRFRQPSPGPRRPRGSTAPGCRRRPLSVTRRRAPTLHAEALRPARTARSRSIWLRSASGSTWKSGTPPGRRVRELVDADDDGLARVDCLLGPVRRFLDFALDEAGFDRRQRSATLVDSRQQVGCASLDLVGHRFDRVRAADGIDGVRHAALAGDDLLRAERHGARLPRSAARALRRGRCSGATACRRAPPRAPAATTRTMLLSGCCAVSVLPAVCV